MLFEGLAVVTGLQLVGVVGRQVLDLGGEALKDYVKDFFKDSIKAGVVGVERRRALELGMAEAIATLTQLFEKELQVRRVDPAIAQSHYREPFKRFLKDKGVRGVLGSAFGFGCEAIDSDALAEIWTQYHPAGVTLKPEKLDWDRIGYDYLQGVRQIVENTPELREVLSLQLQKQSTAAMVELAGPRVGFDLRRYRESLLEQYGALKLESLGASRYEKGDANYRSVKLWNVFVAQTAREFETVAPQVLEIPKERLRRMQVDGLVDGEVEAIWEAQKGRYFDRSPRSVLEICADPQIPYLVVLGDPGAGKSTLVRYLAVDWARSPQDETAPIPLLIELRRYIQSKTDGECKNFLEFIHQGSNWVGNLNQGELDRILSQGQVLVMFDGLDEVVERGQRGNVLKAIHGFSQTYPQARIVVTSRVIGYRAEDLRGAGFRHFMLQDLDRGQMQRFVEDWHQITYGDAVERERKQGRLERAIDRSKAIFELAGNPLLLTLMAILNRGEELPRDRVRLYEKAAEVLLFQWDFEEKEGLVDPRLAKYLVELDFRDKRAMLQQVAYRMQSSEQGLAGNFVTREVLETCLVDYLKHKKDAASASSIAGLVIEQLRERNFILCALGGDNYAFIHRTFLEYFCAIEIVERFGKRGAEGGLTFEQLRDEVFGAHWQDPTWHEVLRLICGEIAPEFAGELIEFLMGQEVEKESFRKENFIHLVLAADCLEEVRDRSAIAATSQNLLKKIQEEVEHKEGYITLHTRHSDVVQEEVEHKEGYIAVTGRPSISLYAWHSDAVDDLFQRVIGTWGKKETIKQWLLDCVSLSHIVLPSAAVRAIAEGWKDDPETLHWLKKCVQCSENANVRSTAVRAIAQGWKDNPKTLPILKKWVQMDADADVRMAAVETIAQGWKDDPQSLPMLKQCAQSDENQYVRKVAVRAIAQGWKDDPETLPWLKDRVQKDDDRFVRSAAVEAIAQGWKDDPETLPWLKDRVQKDDDRFVRSAAVEAIARGWKDDPDTLPLLKACGQQDDEEWVRSEVVEAIFKFWKDDLDSFPWLKERVQQDDSWEVRSAAVRAIAEGWKEDPETLSLLKERVQQDDDGRVRYAAVRAIAEYWKEDPETLPLLKERVQRDDNEDVRKAALGAIGESWLDEPGIIIFSINCILSDAALRPEELQDKSAQEILEKLVEEISDDAVADKVLRAIAQEHEDETLRNWAIQKLDTRNSLSKVEKTSE